MCCRRNIIQDTIKEILHLPSIFRVNRQYSEEFIVRVDVHTGSVLRPLLFILVIEALSWEFRTGVPRELLYTDDLTVIAETLEECITKLKAWTNGMESRESTLTKQNS